MSELKGFPTIELEPTCSQTDKKLHLVYPRSFFVRVGISRDRPGHPKSRPQMTLETFNLSATMAEKLKQEVQANIDNNASKDENQEFMFAKH